MSTNLNLFDKPAFFDGETYDAKLDQKRLSGQLGKVYDVMKDGRWRTLNEIGTATGVGSEAAISARLRDLRKARLALKPSYCHRYQQSAPTSSLTALTAYDAYVKLRNFISIKNEPDCPAGGWENGRRDLFTANGFHHRVRWKPKVNPQWRALTYAEFCAWYGLE